MTKHYTEKYEELAYDKSCCGMDAEDLKRSIMTHLLYSVCKHPVLATMRDCYTAISLAIRDRLLRRWIESVETYLKHDVRIVAYLSAEYLPGAHLANHVLNLSAQESLRQATDDMGMDLDRILAEEEEPGLGNGGLGRLASCFMDSLATLHIPAMGYGIRYEYGLFTQRLMNGWQVEQSDQWLRKGNPWEIIRPEIAYEVKLSGHTESGSDASGRFRVRWVPDKVIKGVSCLTPVSGFGSGSVAFMNLWKAEAVESFDYQAFNKGDYLGAVFEKMYSETISKVLYPNDEPVRGKQLRLAQQYFFVSCSLQDMLRLCRTKTGRIDTLPSMFAIQLNDTHPAIAVAELMRLLVDEHDMDWEQAWDITTRSFSYTNHTLLPEALETWSEDILREVLPRHLEIIFEINRRFLDDVRARVPGDDGLLERLSLIDERRPRHVRMANLACAASSAINGVSKLHSELLKQSVLKDFNALWPEKFRNVTNGVTPRRWMALANPGMARLITSRIGDAWIRSLETEIVRLEPFADDQAFRDEWRAVKLGSKTRLAALIQARTGIEVRPDSIFDIQTKRFHEYKRQHLNILRVIHAYNSLKRGAHDTIVPRTIIFGGKAAPGYQMAKLIIKLITSVAEVVNADPETNGLLKVVLLPNFGVGDGQAVYPAADLSEQISTAGKEASGTGNMKFMMNGALTIGTLDGANVEIREAAGPENFFLFGLTTEEVLAAKARGYRPREACESVPGLGEVFDQIASGRFSGGDREVFKPLVESLLDRDEFMVLADFAAYVECQETASLAYADADGWARKSILNVARSGPFSSDRAIREYCRDIWHVQPVVPSEAKA